VSKYLTYTDVVFRSRDLLLASLAELGFDKVEEGQDLPLYGYHGDRRPETAAIVVRREHIGLGSNDLGFARIAEGFVPIISEFDERTLLAGRFLPQLRTVYAQRVVETVRRRLRGSVQRVNDGTLIKLRVRY
jgi:Protein of unknown function (DUF1257)